MDTYRDESIGVAAREVVDSLKDVMRSEMRLAKAEISDTGKRLTSHVGQIAIFGTIAALSALPLMAFLVIGLGRLLDGRYWLSSLIVGVLFLAVGGLMAMRAAKKMKSSDFSLPHTRNSLETERAVVSTKVTDIRNTVTRRSA